MVIIKLVYTLLLLLPALAEEKLILTCVEDKSVHLTYADGGWFSAPGLQGSTANPEASPSAVTLLVTEKSATLKGNMDQVSLLPLGGMSFLEVTPLDTKVLWTVLPGKKKGLPTYLFSMKAYSLFAPYSGSVAYKCQ